MHSAYPSQGGVYSGEIKPNNPVNATSAIYVNYPVRLAKKITVFAYIDRDYAGFNGESVLVLESYTNYATFELNSHAIRTSHFKLLSYFLILEK